MKKLKSVAFKLSDEARFDHVIALQCVIETLNELADEAEFMEDEIVLERWADSVAFMQGKLEDAE